MLHRSHSNKFWVPWQQLKRSFNTLTSVIPEMLQDLCLAFGPWIIQHSPQHHYVSVYCTPPNRGDCGFLLRSILIDDPLILSIYAICHCHSVTILKHVTRWRSEWRSAGKSHALCFFNIFFPLYRAHITQQSNSSKEVKLHAGCGKITIIFIPICFLLFPVFLSLCTIL